jgi:predicted amidophosphoribosyltransferase
MYVDEYVLCCFVCKREADLSRDTCRHCGRKSTAMPMLKRRKLPRRTDWRTYAVGSLTLAAFVAASLYLRH